MSNMKAIICYKCTRSNGTDFYSGTLNYATAFERGVAVEILDAEPPTGNVCGHGIHVSPTAKQTIQFSELSLRPWRWFMGEVVETDIIERDSEKMRVRRFLPVQELTFVDIFGEDMAERMESVREDIGTWKTIPWLRPARIVNRETIEKLVGEWCEATSPWLKSRAIMPSEVKIVRTAKAAAANANADANAADAAADANAAANAAAADAAADAAAADAFRRYWLHRYVRPYYVLSRSAWWDVAGLLGDNPWKPLVQLYRLGCLPVGFSGGAFVVYWPR